MVCVSMTSMPNDTWRGYSAGAPLIEYVTVYTPLPLWTKSTAALARETVNIPPTEPVSRVLMSRLGFPYMSNAVMVKLSDTPARAVVATPDTVLWLADVAVLTTWSGHGPLPIFSPFTVAVMLYIPATVAL